MIVQTKSPSHGEDISLVRDSSIPTRNGESTISSVVAESPASGHLARGQSRPRSHSAYWAARRACDSELAASSLPLRAPRRQGALGGRRPPGAPARGWRRRAGAEAAAAAWAGPGGLGAAAGLLLRECRAGACTGAGLPGPCAQGHRNASEGRSLRGAGAWPRPRESPFEASRGTVGRAQRSVPGDARPTVSCTAARQAN
jgi:hypothetical protein